MQSFCDLPLEPRTPSAPPPPQTSVSSEPDLLLRWLRSQFGGTLAPTATSTLVQPAPFSHENLAN